MSDTKPPVKKLVVQGNQSYTTSTQEAFQSPSARKSDNKENRVDFSYPLQRGTQQRTLSLALLEAQDVLDPEQTGGVWKCNILFIYVLKETL